MTMDESGRAIRELLARMTSMPGWPGTRMTTRDVVAAGMLVRARLGGRHAIEQTRGLIEAGRAATARVAELERDLGDANQTIRAMVGAGHPHDQRQPIDPPAGHCWLTSMPIAGAPQPYDGRLYCTTCTAPEVERTTSPRIVLAAECLERAR